MFRKDGDPIREFCGFNLVYHSVGDPKWSRICTAAETGVLNPSTAQNGRQIVRFLADFRGSYLTAICGVADNNGLFAVPVSLLA
jgi:hypothetical protein